MHPDTIELTDAWEDGSPIDNIDPAIIEDATRFRVSVYIPPAWLALTVDTAGWDQAGGPDVVACDVRTAVREAIETAVTTALGRIAGIDPRQVAGATLRPSVRYVIPDIKVQP